MNQEPVALVKPGFKTAMVASVCVGFPHVFSMCSKIKKILVSNKLKFIKKLYQTLKSRTQNLNLPQKLLIECNFSFP
jgi:hypothetical protein